MQLLADAALLIVLFSLLCYYRPMIGFFLKKNFFEGWDNFLPLILFNGVLILIGSAFFTLAYAVSEMPVLSVLILFICILLMGILLLAISNLMSRIADYKSFSFKEIGGEIKHTWRHGVLFALIETFCWVVAGVAVPYYFSFHNFLGLFLGVSVVWIFVVIQLSRLWLFSITSRLEKKFLKCLKKLFFIFFFWFR